MRLDPDRKASGWSVSGKSGPGRIQPPGSEHGVGSRKRKYVGMSREPADIAAMRTLKTAFDPTGYLNAAVLFD